MPNYYKFLDHAKNGNVVLKLYNCSNLANLQSVRVLAVRNLNDLVKVASKYKYLTSLNLPVIIMCFKNTAMYTTSTELSKVASIVLKDVYGYAGEVVLIKWNEVEDVYNNIQVDENFTASLKGLYFNPLPYVA